MSKRAEKPSASNAPWERLGELGEYRELCRARIEHLVPVREPLVLISQIQRSGGTLLSQLFDGHPECHAHPSEIYIGHPRKWEWPVLELERPETWFDVLYESPVDLHLRDGYVKHKESRLEPDHDVFPFLFLPELQRTIFEKCISARRPTSMRDVLDCYFTSYFNAWLDNQNLFSGTKKVVTGFTPRLATEVANVEGFFSAYPDGTLVSIVRDPAAWYESARKYRPYFEDLDGALAQWSDSTAAAVEAYERFGERVVIVTYEELVLQTEPTMRRLAERIGISMAPILLEPTFNRRPVRANSSESAPRYGVLTERATAYRDSLDAAKITQIDERAGELYRRACGLAGSLRSAAGSR